MGTRRHLGPRVVLLVAAVLGLASLGESLAAADLVGANFRVYRTAADAVLAGESMYDVAPAGLSAAYSYLYPPVTVVAFLPLALVPWEVGFALFSLGSVAAGVALAVVCGRYVERSTPLSPIDYALLTGFVLLSPLAAPSLVYGNVNVLVAAAVGVGFAAFETDRDAAGRLAGTALAASALAKLFPAGFAWWYVRERATAALAWGCGVAAAALLGGLLAFGVDAHATYLDSVVLPRLAGDAGAGSSYVTVRRPLSHVVGPTAVGPAAALVLGGVVLALTAGRIDGRSERLLTLCGTVAAAVVFVPSYPLYLLYLSFPLLPALYLVEDDLARPLVHVGVLCLVVTVQAEDLSRVVAATGVEAATALEPLLSVATPPLFGVVALWAAGFAVRVRRVRRAERRR
jgi:hypothetical protein